MKQESASIRRLQSWVAAELEHPAPVGARNNQMIRVMPRMIELGWDDEGIIDAWLEAYEVGDDKRQELEAVLANAHRYAEKSIRTGGHSARAAQSKAVQTARMQGERWLPHILADPWTMSDIIQAGGLEHWTPQEQQTAHLSLFDDDDIIWLGAVHQSGLNKQTGQAMYAHHFTYASSWRDKVMTRPLVHEFVSHCTFHPGTVTRSNTTMRSRRFVVVESDELSLDDIGSVFAWLNANMLKLRAVVYSGGKSLHGWFDDPKFDSEEKYKELSALLAGLRCDPSTLRASQPVRFAGAMRKDKHKIQSLLYFDPPHGSANSSNS